MELIGTQTELRKTLCAKRTQTQRIHSIDDLRFAILLRPFGRLMASKASEDKLTIACHAIAEGDGGTM